MSSNAKTFNITANPAKKIYFNSISIDKEYNITLNNLLFTDNKTINNSGILNLYNCSYINNTLNQSGIQANIYNNNATLNIKSSSFINNQANLRGVIYNENKSTVNIEDSTFAENTANTTAAIISQYSNLTITNSIFRKNTANIGSAISSLGEKSQLYINNTIFEDNYAHDYGTITSWYSKITIENTNITNNRALNKAGALALIGCEDAVLKGNIIYNNTADKASIIYSLKSPITAQYNVIYNDENNEWIDVKYSNQVVLDDNWWGSSSPDFKTITNKIIPDTWIYYKVSNTSNEIKINAYKLLDEEINSIPPRKVSLECEDASLEDNESTITDNLTIKYTGDLSNLRVKIDNEELRLNEKLDAIIIVDDIMADVNDNININITSNSLTNGNISIYINNELLTKSQISNGFYSTNYTVNSTLSDTNNTINVIFDENEYFKQSNATGILTVRYNLENQTSIITPLYSFNNTTFNKRLPASYDTRRYGYDTTVKNQKSSGSCWAFSALATLETILKKNDGIEYDFSENNFKNLMKKYSFIGNTSSPPNDGATLLTPINYLIGWYGPVLESDEAYDEYSLISSQYNPSIHIQDIYIPKSSDVKTFINNMKLAVYNQGAISVSYKSSSSYNIYYNDTYESDHAVTIIGWNDNYDKSRFKDPLTSEVPPANGAFIVKNSWSDEWGLDGYFYISYYDSSLYNSREFFYTILLDNQDNYTNIYQYDSMAEYLSFTKGGRWIKHNYIATGDEAISAVGSYILNQSEYQVNVYVNDKLRYTQEGIINITGYRTIQLDKQIPIKANDTFTVELEIKSLESDYTYYIKQDLKDSIYNIQRNQSLYRPDNDNSYYDNYDENRVDVLKVYTKEYTILDNRLTMNDAYIMVNSNITSDNSNANITYTLFNMDNNNSQILDNVEVNENKIITVKLNKKNLTSGNYLIYVNYTSDKQYMIEENITFTFNQTIIKEKIIATLNHIKCLAGENIILQASIITTDGELVNNGKVVFKINGKTIKNETTGKVIYVNVVDGIAILEYNIPINWNNKELNISVVYSGTSRYYSARNSTTTIVEVDNEGLKVSITPFNESIKRGSNITLHVKVTINSNPETNGKVVFKINGKTLKDSNNKILYFNLDENGEVSYDYNLGNLKAKTYTVEALYINSLYDRISDSTNITIVN